MLKRFFALILIAFILAPPPAAAIKYKGDLESNESITLPEQSSTPSNPVSGKRKVYAKDDGVLYQLDSAGKENPVDAVGLKNKIINGNFDIWQRGTSFSSFTGFKADRWKGTGNTDDTVVVSRQAFTLGQTDVPGEPAYYMQIAITAGTTGTFNQVDTSIEGVRTLAGQTVTLSYYAKASASVTLNSGFFSQNFGTGGSPSTFVSTAFGTTALTTAWQKFTKIVALPAISGKTLGTDGNDFLGVLFRLPLLTTITVDIAQVQLEKGPIATEFEQRPMALEQALAQRYYEKQTAQTVNGDVWITWHAVKRGTPTTSTTAGTLNNTTVDGSRLNHNASAVATLTASAEL